jgi:signal peptidase I
MEPSTVRIAKLQESHDDLEPANPAVRHAERQPWVAGVLTLLLPGLGHLYLGRPVLAVSWFAALELLVLAYALIARSPLFPPLVNLAGILIPVAGYVFATLSALRLARTVRHGYRLQIWNRWPVYLGLFVVGATLSGFLSDAIKEFVVKTYKIPSDAMTPTLLRGDHILVDRLIYRAGNRPQRGDIIVFQYPEDERKDFVKRIVGTPGDIVEIRAKRLLINGIHVDDEAYTQRVDPKMIDPSINPRDNYGPVTVPAHSYFVLGDNRDQSLDSRFWGYVDSSKIKGKVTVIYWFSNGLATWRDWFRWERIGRRV